MIIVRLENKEVKKEMMRNKFKLKGEKIFIENNLSWEKRKIQEKINRSIKKQKEKSLEVKVGLARVRVKGVRGERGQRWKGKTRRELIGGKEKI